jgi:SAM-dependent methyltransferase
MLECTGCGRTFPSFDGIPSLLPEPSTEEGDATASHKRQQAEFFDAEASPEWEVMRPHGAPPWHRWMLEEKVRRGLRYLRPMILGRSALVVCGGSGMDAELLSRAGVGSVVSSDLSVGGSQRARERSMRFGLDLICVVADVERLPFSDRSFDLVFVHDGLHHLEDPSVGLQEMARVARTAVSVNEPANAAATKMAVRAGLSEEHEEAGNRVARMVVGEVADVLTDSGFEVVGAERYAMLYRHEPGAPSRLLSKHDVFPFARRGWRAVNALAGRFGNKLTVQATRREGT